MGLSLMNSLSDQQRRINELTAALAAAEHRGDQAEIELRTERRKNVAIEKGVQKLRQLLSPFHQWVGVVFGEFDAMGVSGAGSGEVSDSPAPLKHSAVWDAWKGRLSPLAGRFIDALLTQPMTQTQLRIAAGCAKGSVPSTVSELHRAGLINKQGGKGGKISLKEM